MWDLACISMHQRVHSHVQAIQLVTTALPSSNRMLTLLGTVPSQRSYIKLSCSVYLYCCVPLLLLQVDQDSSDNTSSHKRGCAMCRARFLEAKPIALNVKAICICDVPTS